jgi:hypothetical protein
MKEKFLNFYNNFNMDDLKEYALGLDFLEILTDPIVVVAIVVLIGLSIYRRSWWFTIKNILTYSFAFAYLFLCVVVIKNSDLSSPPVFIMFLSAFFLITGRSIYKYLMT